MTKRLEEAALTDDLPRDGLEAGRLGTVMMGHARPDGTAARYTLDFPTLTGQSVAVVTAEAVRQLG